MVWIHGGGFVTGVGDGFLGPGYLLDRDVILVSINYRLGVFGFMSMGKEGENSDIQGNQGMWDQVEGNWSTHFILSIINHTIFALICSIEMGQEKYSFIWWGPKKGYHFWNQCRWYECQCPPGSTKARQV